MAFPATSGYNNLPNGNFSPVIFSKKAQMAFRKTSVVADITNGNYFGEIANFGDSVRIMLEPDITITAYTRGKQIVPQDLEDDDYTLVIDQANTFSFYLDDIEKKHAHHDWMDMASDRAAYKMKDHHDREVLAYLSGFVYSTSTGLWTANTTVSGTVANSSAGTDEWLAANQLYADDFVSGAGATEAVVMGVDGTFDATPLQILNRINRLMDQNSVPKDGRWVVVDPVFEEFLLDENSKLVNADWGVSQSGNEGLLNGRITTNKIRGFRLYRSNNLPQLGTGSDTVATTASRSSTNLGFIVAGHESAVATASQITKTEPLRSQSSFGDIIRGLQVYGRKILRPEALYRVAYNVNK